MTPRRKNQADRYMLTPDFLHPLPRYSRVPWAIKDEADDLVADAYEEVEDSYPQAIAKIRKALDLDPDCAGAFAFLADYNSKTPTETVEYYRKAIVAAAFVLGHEFFEKYIGEFWDWECSRPYMGYLARLANRLYVADKPEESLACYKRLLELNLNDSMGIRYHAIHLMMELSLDEDAESIFETIKDENITFVRYAECLLKFRKTGDSVESHLTLKRAMKLNRHIPKMLLGGVSSSNRNAYSPSDETEAIDYCSFALSAWLKTPRAIDWLKKMVTHKTS